MSEMTTNMSREYMGILRGLGIVKDKCLLIRHFTEDQETMDAVIAELMKLKKKPTPKEAEDLIMDTIIKQRGIE